MDWYNSLSIDQKINAKECFVLACGVEWSALSFMFSIRDRIEILHHKLVLEGIL